MSILCILFSALIGSFNCGNTIHCWHRDSSFPSSWTWTWNQLYRISCTRPFGPNSPQCKTILELSLLWEISTILIFCLVERLFISTARTCCTHTPWCMFPSFVVYFLPRVGLFQVNQTNIYGGWELSSFLSRLIREIDWIEWTGILQCCVVLRWRERVPAWSQLPSTRDILISPLFGYMNAN